MATTAFLRSFVRSLVRSSRSSSPRAAGAGKSQGEHVSVWVRLLYGLWSSPVCGDQRGVVLYVRILLSTLDLSMSLLRKRRRRRLSLGINFSDVSLAVRG